MTTAADNVVGLTGNPLIDGLTWGAAWQFGGGAHVLTYSLSLNDTPGNQPAWTTALSNAVRQALAEWSNVANLSFVEVGSGGIYDQSPADLAILLTGNELQAGGLVGLGVAPSPSLVESLLAAGGGSRAAYPQPEGDIALDNYYNGFSYLSPGGVGLAIMLHEIGHALGLKHTNNGPDGRPTFISLGITNLDSQRYTVMSYTDAQGQPLGTTNQNATNAATPMMLDILAMQQIYGANMSFRAGNDTYTIDPSGTSSSASTIWDTGGNDTITVRAGSIGYATIDLREGHHSVLGGYQVAIAYGVMIENGAGGNYGDVLYGNAAANLLDGGGANDEMDGGDGNDTLTGGLGNDTLDGGWGLDTAHFAGSKSDYIIIRRPGSYTVTDNNVGNGNDGIDTLSSIERLQFADGMVALANGPLQHAARPTAPPMLDSQRDFNGDGKNDVLRLNANGNTEISLMDGADTLATLNIGPYAGWMLLDARGDFNGDGKADLTWRHTDGSIALWLMDGVRPTTMEIIDPHMNWRIVDTQRDFNGDGKSDLLWKHADGSTSIWLMDGVDATAKRSFASHTGWNLLGVRGDYNADGNDDLTWRHMDGRFAVWMMDGVNMTSVQAIMPHLETPTPAWILR